MNPFISRHSTSYHRPCRLMYHAQYYSDTGLWLCLTHLRFVKLQEKPHECEVGFWTFMVLGCVSVFAPLPVIFKSHHVPSRVTLVTFREVTVTNQRALFTAVRDVPVHTNVHREQGTSHTRCASVNPALRRMFCG